MEGQIEFEFEVQKNITQDVITQAELFPTDELPELSTMKFETQEINPVEAPQVDLTQAKATSVATAQVDASLSHREDVITDRPSRSDINIRNTAREMRYKEITIKLQTPSGLTAFDDQPRYPPPKFALELVKSS